MTWTQFLFMAHEHMRQEESVINPTASTAYHLPSNQGHLPTAVCPMKVALRDDPGFLFVFSVFLLSSHASLVHLLLLSALNGWLCIKKKKIRVKVVIKAFRIQLVKRKYRKNKNKNTQNF